MPNACVTRAPAGHLLARHRRTRPLRRPEDARAGAEVAALLLSGRSTREIAESRGVGLETIRTQLESLWRKVGVSGQAELVRVPRAGATGLARPEA